MFNSTIHIMHFLNTITDIVLVIVLILGLVYINKMIIKGEVISCVREEIKQIELKNKSNPSNFFAPSIPPINSTPTYPLINTIKDIQPVNTSITTLPPDIEPDPVKPDTDSHTKPDTDSYTSYTENTNTDVLNEESDFVVAI